MGLSHDTGACENCGTSVHRTGQNWQHIGGHYRCPGSHWDGDGFAVRGELVRAASEGLYEAVHEEVADDVGVPVEVVPAPADSAAKCDLALLTTLARAPELQHALAAEGVPFRPWP